MDQAPEAANDRFQKHALAFDARRSGFARLLLVNSLLALITLGIYRFWARTKVRRFLWRHVTFLDDPLEYTGTGGELFVGFLIVIAILFPLGLIYKAIGTVVPPDNQSLRVGLEITYYMVLFALLQIGFYRMWRSRMSRTTWRGVRFRFPVSRTHRP
ncbi:MAG: YjgN family protein, partial [Rhodospirillales bacterium]|nr:YjgN family protein [Rhodospirillales bacterium]